MTRPTPVLMSWSGGKDSALALYELVRSPDWEVVGLFFDQFLADAVMADAAILVGHARQESDYLPVRRAHELIKR